MQCTALFLLSSLASPAGEDKEKNKLSRNLFGAMWSSHPTIC